MAFDYMDGPQYQRAHLAVFDPRMALMGQISYVIALWVVYYLYRDVTPEADLRLWLWMVAIVVIAVAGFDIAFVIRRPDADELMRFWRKVDKRVPAAFDLLAIGVLFLLFPHAPPELRSLSVAFFVGYAPMQMISDPENAKGNQFSIIVVLGSFALSLVIHGTRIDHALAALVVVYGTVLIIASQVLRRGVINAMIERQKSDGRATDLEVAMTALTEERDAKTRFIATAAHDLSQPIIAARLLANQIDRAALSQADQSKFAYLQTGLESINTMTAHMLQSLRLQADAVTPLHSTVSVGSVFEDVAAKLVGMANDAGIKIKVNSSKKTLFTDRVLLDRALTNLVINAIVHSAGNSVHLGLQEGPAGYIRMYVADNGHGIDPADYDDLFRDFYRGKPNAIKAAPGFGLGLSSVRRLAHLLGGQAGFDKDTAVGATFWIELPVTAKSRLQ